MERPEIKNIIFDLGNVVIDILPKATYDAFASISRTKNSEEVENIISEKKLWHNYEKGLISDSKFRELLRSNLDLDATDAEIDEAFNALLLDIDPARI
jgi:glucose-1-phosphatase